MLGDPSIDRMKRHNKKILGNVVRNGVSVVALYMLTVIVWSYPSELLLILETHLLWQGLST